MPRLQFHAGELKAIADVGDATAATELAKCVGSSGTREKSAIAPSGLTGCAESTSSRARKRKGPLPDLSLFAAGPWRRSLPRTPCRKPAEHGAAATFDDMQQLPGPIAQIAQKPPSRRWIFARLAYI
jgi:hypothetical protein